jgi:hypothetical protein
MFDNRALEKGPIQTLPVQGSAGCSALLNPVWDQALPLLYMTGKSEGIRTIELIEGELRDLATLKIEKQAVSRGC